MANFGNLWGQTAGCCIESDITFQHNEHLNYQFPNGATLTNKIICVNGDLYVNVDLNVNNCTLYMASEARIIIENGAKIISKTSIFRGCERIWKGIEVQAGCSVQFSLGSQVRDARRGIWLKPGYKMDVCSITRTLFLDNVIGVEVGNGFNSTAFNFSFSNNKFSSAGVMGTTLLPPLTGQIAGTGIFFNRVKPAMINANTGNVFSLTQTGIRASNSTVTILSGTFLNHREVLDAATDPVNSVCGQGIVSARSSLTVSGCKFYNEPIGCISSGSDFLLNITRCTLQNFGTTASDFIHGYGIKAEPMSSSAFLDIYDNDFLMTASEELAAIRVLRPRTLTAGSRIDLNRITDTGDHGSGSSHVTTLINVRSGLVANDALSISGNIMTINMKGSTSGIVLNGNSSGSANGYSVFGNTITYSAPISATTGAGDAHGIEVKNVTGSSNTVRGNTVTATLSANPNCNLCSRSWAQCGVHLEASLNWTVCTNTVGGTVWNYHLVSSLGMMEFETNTSLGAETGVFGENTSSFSQIRQANVYAPSALYSAFAAYHSNQKLPVATLATLPNWRFIELIPDIPTKRAPATWFSIHTSQPFTNVCLPEPPPPFTDDPQGHTPDDQNLIAGLSIFPTSVAGWDAKRQMLYRMLRYPVLRVPNTPDEQYFLQNQTGSAWAFASAEKQVLDAFSPFTASSATMNGYFSTLQSLTDQMIALSAQHPSDSVYDATVLAAQMH